jgi:RNA polymerase sigma-70 factor (ECF subfamily)
MDARQHRFRSLYEAHYAEVWAFAVRRLPSVLEVPDVVADVFTVAWRRLDRVPEPPEDLLWLFGVAHRVLANQRRSISRRNRLIRRLQEQPETPPMDHPRSTTSDLLLSAIEELRAGERDALRLVVWEGLTHAQAATILGSSANAIAIRVHRAKGRLRKVLTAHGIERSSSEPTINPSRKTRS